MKPRIITEYSPKLPWPLEAGRALRWYAVALSCRVHDRSYTLVVSRPGTRGARSRARLEGKPDVFTYLLWDKISLLRGLTQPETGWSQLSLREVIRQEWAAEARIKEGGAPWLALGLMFSCFSYISQNHLPSVAQATVAWAIQHQSITQEKHAIQTCLQADLMEGFFSTKVLASKVILVCVKMNQHTLEQVMMPLLDNIAQHKIQG